MSKALEERIKAIMSGETLVEDKTMTQDATSKKAAHTEEDVQNDAEKQAKKTAGENKGKLPTANGDHVPELPTKNGTFKEDKGSPDTVPDIGGSLKGDSTSGVSGDAKTSKITAKKDGSSEAVAGKVGLKGEKLGGEPGSAADPQDPAAKADTDKITAKRASTTEKGGKLHAEHMEALFGGETLSEAFKEKAETIFEAAVAHIVEQRVAALEEAYQEKISESSEATKGELVEQIDGFLDDIVEQWIVDNAVALESGMKVELVNSFIDGIKNVFQEHYVEVPAEKINVVEEQAAQIEQLQSELAAIHEEKAKAEGEAMFQRCESIVSELASGLTAIETEKFKSLIEGVEFENEGEFEKKAKIIREAHFKKDVNAANNSQEVTNHITESTSHSDNSGVNAVLAVLQKGDIKFVR